MIAMGVNKVEYGDRTLIDLTNDTVSPESLKKGFTAHDKTGELITGTLESSIPDGYVDTSGATAEPIDICIDKTAFVNGELVTGTYTSIGGNQYSSTSANCSESELVVPCNFIPKACCVVFNSADYAVGKIISCWAILDSAIVYHSYSSSRTLSTSDYEVVRSQITSNVSSYVWYADGYLHIKRPSSTYSWLNRNYRVFAFK